MCASFHDLVNFRYFRPDVHKVLPASQVAQDKKRCYCLVHIVKVVVSPLPLISHVDTVPLVEYFALSFGIFSNSLSHLLQLIAFIVPALKIAYGNDSEYKKEQHHHHHYSDYVRYRLN